MPRIGYRARIAQRPHLSPDGRYRWNGAAWVPVAQPAAWPAPSPRRARRWHWVLGTLCLVLVVGVCASALGSAGGGATAARTDPSRQAGAGGAARAAEPSCSAPCADVDGWIAQAGNVRYDFPSGNPWARPETGNVFVAVDVTFVNRTRSEQHANPFQFVLQDGTGVKHPVVFGPCEPWQAVNLTPGASLGPKCLSFQAAAGRPSGLRLVWTPGLFGGDHPIRLT